MELSARAFFVIVLCAGFASAQSSPAPNEDRVFSFTYTSAPQPMQEIATVIRSIGELNDLSVDVGQKQLSLHGSSDQIALATWLFRELDRPGNQEPSNRTEPPREYRMAIDGDNVVRVFYLPYTKTIQELQEVATAVRSTSNIRRMFTYNAPHVVITRSTSEQASLADWMFNEFGKASDSMPRTYQLAPNDAVCVFHMTTPPTAEDMVEVITLMRSITETRTVFSYNEGNV